MFFFCVLNILTSLSLVLFGDCRFEVATRCVQELVCVYVDQWQQQKNKHYFPRANAVNCARKVSHNADSVEYLGRYGNLELSSW